MISIGAAELDAWIAGFLFPLARVLGLLGAAPVFFSRGMPTRIRLALGVAVTVALMSSLPPSTVAPGTWMGLLTLMQQMLIGVMLGFAMRIVFAAIDLAGELIGLQMGLGFALFYDPENAGQSPVIAEFMGLLATLVFLAMNGHLMLLALLGKSFEWWPIGAQVASLDGMGAVARWGSFIFSAGLMLSLPLIAALLIVNIALALLTRAAPQLNLFAIGFPVTLIVGFAVLSVSLAFFAPVFTRLFEYGLEMLGQLAGA